MQIVPTHVILQQKFIFLLIFEVENISPKGKSFHFAFRLEFGKREGPEHEKKNVKWKFPPLQNFPIHVILE